MKIAVLGAGALGSLFGGRLSAGGNEVWLIDPHKELVEAVRRDGVFITGTDGKVENIRVNIVETPQEAADKLGRADMILVLTKGMFTEAAVVGAKPLVGDDTYFLTLQNGIGNPQIIEKYYPGDRIFYGATVVGGTSEGLGRVTDRSAPGATSSIMALSGVLTPALECVADVLSASGMKTGANAQAEQLIWEKLAMNCVANSSSVITRLTNGNFIRDANGQELAKMIVREVCNVGNAKGLAMDFDKIMPWIIEKLSPQTEMFSSMAMDAKNKRQIEIETITGGVIKEADKLDIPVPVNRTIYYFDKVIASNYDRQY